MASQELQPDDGRDDFDEDLRSARSPVGQNDVEQALRDLTDATRDCLPTRHPTRQQRAALVSAYQQARLVIELLENCYADAPAPNKAGWEDCQHRDQDRCELRERYGVSTCPMMAGCSTTSTSGRETTQPGNPYDLSANSAARNRMKADRGGRTPQPASPYDLSQRKTR